MDSHCYLITNTKAVVCHLGYDNIGLRYKFQVFARYRSWFFLRLFFGLCLAALIQSWAILCPALDIDSVIRLRCLLFLRRDTVEVVNVIIITMIRVAHIMLISLAIQYATSLKETIRTVIIGAEKVLPEGSEYPDMSLLSFIADTIMVCFNTNSCTSGNEECFLCKSCMAKKRIIQ